MRAEELVKKWRRRKRFRFLVVGSEYKVKSL